MDLLTITLVFWIAGIHCMHVKKLRKGSGAMNAENETQEPKPDESRPNLPVPKCLDVHNKATMYQILEKHNYLRKHPKPKASDMLKMVWSEDVVKNAENWGKKCDFKHSPLEERMLGKVYCGENIIYSPGPMTWSEIIDAWFNEYVYFTYGVGGVPGEKVGHYTQVVNAKSYYLGCTVVPCYTWYYFICQYCPPGNLAHMLLTPYTEGEPCGTCKDHCDDGLCINTCVFFDVAGNCAELKGYCGFSEVVKICEKTCKC